VRKGTGIPLFARARLLEKCTDPLGPRSQGVVVLDRPGEPTLRPVGLFLAAKKEVLADRPGVLVVGLDPLVAAFVVIVIVITVVVTIAVIGSIAVVETLVVIVVVPESIVVLTATATADATATANATAATTTVGRKGPLDLFQPGRNPAKAHGGLEFLEGLCLFNVLFRRIDSGAMDVIRILFWFRFLRIVAAFLLFRALLDPVALDLAQLARVSIRRDAEFFGFVGSGTYICHGELFLIESCWRLSLLSSLLSCPIVIMLGLSLSVFVGAAYGELL